MPKRKLIIGSILSFGLFANAANANLVTSDWQIANDKNIITDTNTGIEWLAFDATYVMSFDSVNADIAIGNQFEGWRFASETEVSNLFDDYLNKASNPFSASGVYSSSTITPGVTVFANAFGIVTGALTSTLTAEWSYGLYRPDAGGELALAGVRRTVDNNTGNQVAEHHFYSHTPGYVDSSAYLMYGHYLVREASLNANNVSTASVGFGALSFIGLGMLSLMRLFRKR